MASTRSASSTSYNNAANLPAGKKLGDTTFTIAAKETVNDRFWPSTRKWDWSDPANPAIDPQYNDQPYLRLAETYLLLAEAQFKQGNLAGAAATINIVRARAKASPITAGAGHARLHPRRAVARAGDGRGASLHPASARARGSRARGCTTRCRGGRRADGDALRFGVPDSAVGDRRESHEEDAPEPWVLIDEGRAAQFTAALALLVRRGTTGRRRGCETRARPRRTNGIRHHCRWVDGRDGRFAAQELSSYLGRISGAAFRISNGGAARKVIALRVERASSPDDYTIVVHGDTLALSGATPRAVLFASYDLLTRLGCRFIAPQLAFYIDGEAEHVPRSATLVYRGAARIAEHPVFAMRKLNVEEGLSHDSVSLRAIVAWMPKARFNTISVPMDYGGAGRVKWDNWRASLTPELRRRGIDVEVGGHGYQNFLNASMQDGALFTQHPDWFGRDSSCAPSRAPQNVFNTTNADAVSFVTAQATRYMRERGEIDILELWPPDGARWSACASSAARERRTVRRVCSTR